ncbi:MAG: T9SS type A sorting domain-containing protein [Prevotella sp.]|nr:T9SS type A sorting domain-containing protein [Prevotella sp.]
MKRKTIIVAATLLCCITSFAQQQEKIDSFISVNEMFPSSFQSAQEGMRNAPATSTSTRIFTYDAAGNRILMSTPARNAPASPYADLSQDEQVSLSMTTGLLRVSLSGEYHEPYSISVYNIAGQLVAERKNCRGMSQDINLSHLERGVYIIDIFEGKNHNKRKITKE